MDSHESFINLNLGGFKFPDIPHPHEDNFMLGYLNKSVLNRCAELINNNFIGLDSVFKLYFNKKMATYLLVTCDNKYNSYIIGFAIFSKDCSENLTLFLKSALDLFNQVLKEKINVIFMIDKSPLEIKSINSLKDDNNYNINWTLCRFHMFKLWIFKFNSLDIKNYCQIFLDFKKLANTSNMEEFDLNFNEIKEKYKYYTKETKFIEYFAENFLN